MSEVVKSVRLRSYKKLLEKLPERIIDLATQKYETFKKDPHHHSLDYEKIKKTKSSPKPLFSVRINDYYRAVGFIDNKDMKYVWIWVGNHREYEKTFL